LRRRRLTITIIGMTSLISDCQRPENGAARRMPIPEEGPLPGPRSSNQAVLPVAATRAVIPADNPQTPEKIPSERNCSSMATGRLTALSRAAPAMIPSTLSQMGGQRGSGSKAASANVTPRLFWMLSTTRPSSGMGRQKRSKSRRCFRSSIRAK